MSNLPTPIKILRNKFNFHPGNLDLTSENPWAFLEQANDIDENPDRTKHEILSIKSLVNVTAGITEEENTNLLTGKREDLVDALRKNGLISSHHISSMTEEAFVRRYSEHLPIEEDRLRKLHQNAENIRQKAHHLYASLRTTAGSDYLNSMRISDAGRTAQRFFKNMPSYQDIFGCLDYDEYEEGMTIFDPVAYFVDLMRITDKYISQEFENLIPDGHSFLQRRPDLGLLELTPQNANSEIPYTRIVVETLETILKPLVDGADIYEHLAAQVFPINLPVHIAHETIRKWVELRNVKLSTLFCTWKVKEATLAAEHWQIQQWQFDGLGTPISKENLNKHYGQDTTDIEKLSELAVFKQAVGLSRSSVDALLFGDLTHAEIADGVQNSFFINQGHDGKPLGIDTNDKITDLTETSLERIARFIRLSNITGISFAWLDWLIRVLDPIGDGANEADIMEKTLITIAELMRLAGEYGINIDAIIPLIGPLKPYGANSAYDKIFPKFKDTVITWNPSDDMKTTNLLASSLKTGRADILLIAARLLFPSVNKIPLNLNNLSALHRQSSLADMLGLNQKELQIWLDLTGIGGKLVFTTEDLVSLLRLRKIANLNIYKLQYIITGKTSPYVCDNFTEEALMQFISSLQLKCLPDDEIHSKVKDIIFSELSSFLNLDEKFLRVAAFFAPPIPDELNLTYWQEVFFAKPDKQREKEHLAYASEILRIFSRVDLLYKNGVPLKILEIFGTQPSLFTKQENMLGIDVIFLLLDAAAYAGKYGEQYYSATNIMGEDIKYKQLAEVFEISELDMKFIVDKTWAGVCIENLHRTFACVESFHSLKCDWVFMDKLLECKGLGYDEAQKFAVGLGGSFDGLDTIKRSALVSAVLVELSKQYTDITDENSLYKFLLIDIGMGEAMKISRIKEGLNAVQLYLHRCRMGMEKGVGRINIPDTWWSWIMNYRLWEANRKIFVYPENYLLPETRHTKSTLFKEAETALQQERAEAGYVEAQYVNYLEKYDSLTQLSPCAAYAADINAQDVMFIFGKTKTQPHSYYMCKQVDGGAWSEWEKIDAKISSEYITPVNVFNRLYILWVEQKTTAKPRISMNEQGVDSKEQSAVKIDVKYTFLNLQNKWVVPQTLISDEIMYHEAAIKEALEFSGSNAADQPNIFQKAFGSSFNPDADCWKRVTAIKLTNRNFENKEHLPYLNKRENSEQLLVMTGSFIYNFPNEITEYYPITDIDNDSDKRLFADKLAGTVNNINILNHLRHSGHKLAGIVKVFNADMEEEFLVDNNEFFIFDEYVPVGTDSKTADTMIDGEPHADIPAKDVVLKPLIDIITNTVGVKYSRDSVLDTLAPATGILPNPAVKDGKIVITDSMLKSFVLGDQNEIIASKLKNYLVTNKIIDENNVLIDASKLMGINLYDYIKGDYFSGVNSTINPIHFPDVHKILLDCLGSVSLFKNRECSCVTPVINLPGKFIYECSDEAFLVSPVPETAEFSKLDTGIKVSFPKFSYVDLINFFNEKDNCDEIMDLLFKENIIDANGFIFYENINRLLERGNDKISFVAGLLHDRAMATNRMFEGRNISKGGSIAIFNLLTANASEGTVTGDEIKFFRINFEKESAKELNSVMRDLITQKNSEELSRIFVNFLQSPFAISARYKNEMTFNNTSQPLHSIKFNVTRLTNATIKTLKNRLLLGGITQFLSLKTQQAPTMPVLPFHRLRPNTENLLPPKATDGIQVDFEGMYGEYNWELFYHIPMLIASLFKNNQLNDLAKKWYEYIYNPNNLPEDINETTFTNLAGKGFFSTLESKKVFDILKSSGVIITDSRGGLRVDGEKFNGVLTDDATTKIMKVLIGSADENETKLIVICNILQNLALATENSFYWNFFPFRAQRLESLLESLKDGTSAIKQYNNNPFNPHAIARLRICAYEKFTVMEYIQNLIDWGDREFSTYTWETITSATMMYVLAFDLLGPRPEKKQKRKSMRIFNFNDIKTQYEHNVFPQFLLYLESVISPAQDGEGMTPSLYAGLADIYFKIPENKNLINLWDIIDDRLFKIRRSLDINGNMRNPSLFDLPIDPLSTARAAAAANNVTQPGVQGIDIASNYRFTYLIEQAKALTENLIRLGNMLLGVLEKQDAEGLGVLINTQETVLFNMMTSIKESRITELERTREASNISLKNASERFDYYKEQADEYMSAGEIVSMETMMASSILNIAGGVMKTASGAARLLPQVGSPFAMKYGGVEVGSSMETFASAMELEAVVLQIVSNCAASIAGYNRRRDEWRLQQKLAGFDSDSIKQQIEALNEQIQAAKKDLSVHIATIEQRRELLSFHQNKFTNEKLYQWLAGRLRGTMLQTYMLCLQLAEQAQAAYQQERFSKEDFINYLYWSNEKNGLLSGESLLLSLNNMQSSFLKNNSRRLEVEKIISLARECPQALMSLKNSGKCSFNLTEVMFAYDYPGMYGRVIKSVSVTIPAVIGPHQTFKAVLTQDKSAILIKGSDTAAYEFMLNFHALAENPPNGVTVNPRINQKIALSKGIDDTGMFILNYNDERYLPFEGTGVVSAWTLDMPKSMNPFDYNTISDVVIKVQYTAEEDISHRDGIVLPLLEKYPRPTGAYFNMRQGFAEYWKNFINDAVTDFKTLTFPVSNIPFYHGQIPQLSCVLVRISAAVDLTGTYDFIQLKLPSEETVPMSMINGIASPAAGAFKNVTYDKLIGDWQLVLNTKAMQSNPNLAQLIENGKINADSFMNIEAVIVNERKI